MGHEVECWSHSAWFKSGSSLSKCFLKENTNIPTEILASMSLNLSPEQLERGTVEVGTVLLQGQVEEYLRDGDMG